MDLRRKCKSDAKHIVSTEYSPSLQKKKKAHLSSPRCLKVKGLILTCVIFHIINIAFLKINSGRYGIEGFKNMILSSFYLLSGGNGGQKVLGI